MKEEKISPCRVAGVGGQAVIEGVMMKNGTKVALAIRKGDGTIEISNSEFHPIKEKHKWANIPIIRGIVGFVESMALSLKTMSKSTNMLGLDELEEQERKEKEAKKAKKKAEKEAKKAEKTGAAPSENADPVSEKAPKESKKSSSSATTGLIMALSLVLGLALAIFLFIALPVIITNLIDIPVKEYINEDGMNQYLKAGIEGVIKVLVFIIYIASVSFMKDIKRTFAYHGAEHKSIACYEAGLELTPENARKCSRFHPRCGTSFLFVMILLGIIVGMFIPDFGPNMGWLRVLCKILTLPIIMGLGYEFIMIAGKHPNWLTRALSAPGLWMQRLTTKEPDDYQLAIAICAIKSTMPEEFPDFTPDEYFISPSENKGHLMYDEKMIKNEEKSDSVSEISENEPQNDEAVSENE